MTARRASGDGDGSIGVHREPPSSATQTATPASVTAQPRPHPRVPSARGGSAATSGDVAEHTWARAGRLLQRCAPSAHPLGSARQATAHDAAGARDIRTSPRRREPRRAPARRAAARRARGPHQAGSRAMPITRHPPGRWTRGPSTATGRIVRDLHRARGRPARHDLRASAESAFAGSSPTARRRRITPCTRGLRSHRDPPSGEVRSAMMSSAETTGQRATACDESHSRIWRCGHGDSVRLAGAVSVTSASSTATTSRGVRGDVQVRGEGGCRREGVQRRP